MRKIRSEFLARETLENHTGSVYPELLSKLESATPTQVELLAKRLDEIQHVLGTIQNHIQSTWATKAAGEVLADKDRRWRHLHEVSKNQLEKVAECGIAPEDITIEGLPEKNCTLENLRSHTLRLIDHLKQGKRILVWPFNSSFIEEARHLVKKIKVNGFRCNTLEGLALLLKYLYSSPLRD